MSTVPPLHPTLRAMLDKAAGLPAMQTFTVQQIRATDTARYASVPRPEVGSVADRTIPGPRGEISIRIYRPDAAEGLPVVVFFHGSGFTICSIDTHDGICRRICLDSGAIIVSVDYGLAPENPFPAGPDDCVAATLWAAGHAREFGGDPARLAVMGDSAGGTMAAVTALRLRDAGGPPVKGLAMLYPVTDHPGPDSYAEHGEGYGLTVDGMHYFWGHYLTDPAQGADPDASPLRAVSFAGLPPTYLSTAEYDPLRDEGRAFARRLEEAGVPVTYSHFDDMNHGFVAWFGQIERSAEALAECGAWLRRNL